MMRLDIDSLYTVDRRTLQRDFDLIWDQVENGGGPVLIRDEGEPDLLLFGWEDYWQRYGLFHKPGEREAIESEAKRLYEAEQAEIGKELDGSP